MIDWTNVLGVATQVATPLGVIVTAVLSWRSHTAIQKVEINMNSKMDAYLALTAKSSLAEGIAAGIATAAAVKVATDTAALKEG